MAPFRQSSDSGCDSPSLEVFSLVELEGVQIKIRFPYFLCRRPLYEAFHNIKVRGGRKGKGWLLSFTEI